MRWAGLFGVFSAIGFVAISCAKFEGDDPGIGSDASVDAPLGDALGPIDGNVADAGLEADVIAPDAGVVTLYVNAFDTVGQLVEEQARDVTITPTYVDTEINSVVKTSAKTVQVSLEVPPGTCVLFDDASLTFTPKP